MKLTVEYKTQIKTVAGVASEEFETESGCTLQELVHHAVKKHGDKLKQTLLDSEQNLQPSILLFLGDRQVRWNDSPELRDRDVLTIFSPISGG